MFNSLLTKIKESFASVMPVVVIVLLVALTPMIHVTKVEITTFLICAVFLMIGIGMFSLGADMAMSPMGEYIGTGVTKLGKTGLLLLISFLMGVVVTIAEPDLHVLAMQVSSAVAPAVLIFSVAGGVGFFLLIAVSRVLFHRELSSILTLAYLVLFALAALLYEQDNWPLLPVCMDSGGVTTGPITVPFLMAMGLGIASTIGGRDSKENSFGMIALCSVGPMVAVILLCCLSSGRIDYTPPSYSLDVVTTQYIFKIVLGVAWDIGKALGLIVLFFLVLQFTLLKLPLPRLFFIFIGLLYTFAGLVIFLSAANIGFLPMGYKLGCELSDESHLLIIGFSFLLGFVTVLAEPAIHVLNRQVEEVTGGAISHRTMLTALCCGVGISLALATVRILFQFSLLYYLVPGYLLSLILSQFVPKMYTAIAFDSGGVASGPLTSGFILPLALGICSYNCSASEALELGFGVVAMVAMTPLITIQLLGFRAVYRKRLAERHMLQRIAREDDEQIIYFNVDRS